MQYKFIHKVSLADTVTPVSVFSRIKEKYKGALLLESNDYRGSVNSRSFICAKPIAEFIVKDGMLSISGEEIESFSEPASRENVVPRLEKFIKSFEVENKSLEIPLGVFGFTSYDAVQYFEDLELQTRAETSVNIPEIYYAFYKYYLVFDHFHNQLTLGFFAKEDSDNSDAQLQELFELIFRQEFSTGSFTGSGSETASLSGEEFKEIVKKCKTHIKRGDVFQIVPSLRFSHSYQGDDFNVYRALRSLNPSPYLFYFDCHVLNSNFRIFGSSPEAHLLVKGNKATIHPIAGTCKRTGDQKQDEAAALVLANDPKETSEHVMLVDLARNDLSRHCDNVKVESFKEIQYYSHVIHLVSQVTGEIKDKTSAPKLVADTFPAGTLSGAPKYRAMQLIDELEPMARAYYGGALGFYGFNADCVHAIMIRSFLSQNYILHYQAGMGVVADSSPEGELEEAHNKLGALRKAIKLAEDI